MNRVVVSLGSNCPDGEERVAASLQWLAQQLHEMRASTRYRTPALGDSTRSYCNAVAVGGCAIEIGELNRRFKEHECSCGRNAEARAAGVVPVDLDIVMWDNEILRPNDYKQRFFQIGWQQLQD